MKNALLMSYYFEILDDEKCTDGPAPMSNPPQFTLPISYFLRYNSRMTYPCLQLGTLFLCWRKEKQDLYILGLLFLQGKAGTIMNENAMNYL